MKLSALRIQKIWVRIQNRCTAGDFSPLVLFDDLIWGEIMGFDDDQDEVEMSLEEFQSMIGENSEIEIDLDDFAAYMEELGYKSIEEEEFETELQNHVCAMRASLECENYYSAFEYAMKRLDYSRFRDEIDGCYKECADHDVIEALIYETERFTNRVDCKLKAEAFPYLYKLNEMGYIQSFRWLADCYYWGVGCERDLQKAEKLYLEDVLFNGSNYSRNMYLSFHPDLCEYVGDNLLKRLIQWYICDVGSDPSFARIKIAELILDGKIKEYAPETAYVLLNRRYDYDGISYYRLGECILNGIGTEKNPLVALYVLKMALYDLEWIVGNFDDEWTKEVIMNPFYEEQDYVDAYEETQRLIENAMEEKSRMSEYDIVYTHNGLLEEEQVIKALENAKIDFIKRFLPEGRDRR